MINDSQNQPDISIILATHNRAAILHQAVASLQNQTWQNFEIIIIDDASLDDTPTVIKDLTSNDRRLRSIRSEMNIGPGAARNLGIELARSKFIAIMDDDDLALPHRLAAQIEVLEKHPEIDLVFSSVAWVDDHLQEINIFPGIIKRNAFPSDPADVFNLLYLESNKIPNTTLMTRKALWHQFCYPEHPWIGEDWYFVMQLAAAGIHMKAIAEPLVRQRRGSHRQGLMQNSHNQVFKSQRQILHMIKSWLVENNIHTFDHLHKLALANQILRESRHFISIKGLMMISQAFWLAPANPKVVEQITWYRQKVTNKIRFSFKGS